MKRCLGCMEEFKDEYQICPHCGYEEGTGPSEAYHMVPGRRIGGRYIVGRTLGFGGFGVTYIGYDVTLDRKVAIKEYLPSDFSTRIPGQDEVTAYAGDRAEQFESGMEKFFAEAQMLAKMQETNGVVQIYNTFKENRTAYIVMEYLEGKTLKTYLEERGKISVAEAKEILLPVIGALKDVHALGIIHRDIAPDNIFLTKDGRVKLLDFGASRFATTSHSKSLSVILKPGYAPVEQYRSRGDQGPWTDVYSLAATMYRAITGVIPEDAMERVEKEDLKKPSQMGVSISKSEENAMMNALNIKVEDRTASVEQFEEELYLSDQVKSRFKRSRKKDVGKWPLWAKMATGAACLGLLLFGGALATGLIDYSYLVPEGMPLPESKTRVPNVVNIDSAKAETMASDAVLVYQIVGKKNSEFIPNDMVLAQGIARGKIVDKNEVLEVTISAGRRVYTLQDVTGMNRTEALLYLSNMGLKVTFYEQYSAVEKDAVYEQSIAAGEQVQSGDSITLTVSLGLDSYIDDTVDTEVPLLEGLSFEEAQKEAERIGVYLVKAESRESDKPVNTVLEQNPKAGERIKQGEKISVVIAAKKVILYMPDVQYREEADAISALKAVGVKTTVEYAEDNKVSKGLVISQSVPANTEVTKNQTVKLVVSTGSPTIVVREWSQWGDSVPGGDYEVEKKTLYRFSNKIFDDGYDANKPGWTQYKTAVEKGAFGAWSDWSTNAPATSADREIESKTQYAYSDYETTQKNDDSSLPGSDWSLIKTNDWVAEDWTGWSDWTETAIAGNSLKAVDTKTQWRQNVRSWTTQNNNSTAPSGYTRDDGKTSVSYGGWSGWTEGTTPSKTSTLDVKSETRYRSVQTGTQYNYFKWQSGYSFSYRKDYAESMGGKTATKYTKTSTSPYPASTSYTDPNTGIKWTSYDTGKGDRYFLESTTPIYSDQPYNVYSTRSITTTYYFYAWSGWQSWQDSEIGSSGDVDVQTRTLYRENNRPQHHTYTFERWTPYTAYSDQAVAGSSTRKVKTQTVYKYRDKTDITHYYFYTWSDWSEFSEEKVDQSDNRRVETKTLYRYRPKN